jgi:hypothetical protein
MRLHLPDRLRTRFLTTGLISCSLLVLATGEATAADSWERQADALLSKMTIDEKIGQMTQIDLAALKEKSDITRLFVGSALAVEGRILRIIRPRHGNGRVMSCRRMR